MVHHLYENSSFVSGKGSIQLKLVKKIDQIHYELGLLDSLSPSIHVNALFARLVEICIYPYPEDVVKDVLIHPAVLALLPNLHSLASRGEYLLELNWAKENNDFKRFVYYKNYQDLVQLEIHSLLGIGASLNQVVFIGSGPLPLSSIIMYQTHKVENIVNIDCDPQSIMVSNELLKRNNIHLAQHQIDAKDYSYESATVVILGALVDIDDKLSLLTVIGQTMKRGTILLIRSAHALRTLLYPALDPLDTQRCGFETVLVLNPFNEVINSILIARKL